MELGRNQKIVLTIAAIIVLTLFSQLGTSMLFGMIMAGALMIIGLVSYSRPASVIGMMLASGSAAASLGQQSMTVTGDILSAAIGLFAPIYLLAWIALSAEEEPKPFVIRRGPVFLTAIYAIACLLSVGVAAFTLGLVAPSISSGMSALMEIAIVLLTATVGITILTFRNPTPVSAGLAKEESGPPET